MYGSISCIRKLLVLPSLAGSLACELLGSPVWSARPIITALVAALIAPHASRLFFPSTRSPAAGHASALSCLQSLAEASGLPPLPDPALDMRLRLGEGTGGCLAAGALRSAAAMLREMSTLQAFLRPD